MSEPTPAAEIGAPLVSGRVDITQDCGLCLHALTASCRSVGLPCERSTPPAKATGDADV